MSEENSSKIQKIGSAVLTVDRNGLLWLTEFRHPYLNRAMQVASRAGDWDAWTAIFLALLAIPRTRPVARVGVKRILAALAVCYPLKRVARRKRPSLDVQGHSTLLSDPDPFSFPSSHAATSWAAYLAMAKEVGGAGWLLVIPAVLVSYSRIHVGAHYPLDVLAGASVGIAAGLL